MKFVLLAWCLFFLASCSTTPKYPEIKFSLAFIFDRKCDYKKELKPEYYSEFEKKLPEMILAWEQKGPALLEKTVNIMQKPYYYKDMRASLFLCRTWVSMSNPLLVKARLFLDSPMLPDKPYPMEIFVGLVFHELLHTYITEGFGKKYPTPLITKYRKEPPGVLAHLHLMALQKSVYLQLGRTNDLAAVIKFERSIGPVYARAWDIVESEGYNSLLKELADKI